VPCPTEQDEQSIDFWLNGEEIAVHQQLGPKGWILADPTGRRQYTDQAKVCSSGG